MLRGRRAEQERIDALLAAARDGISGALVVRGEPGIGKTALLEHAAQRAEGMRLLHGSGIESEAELPFAGLHLLLRPAADALEALPGPQGRALAGVFGLGEAGGGDRFLIGAAVLSLLAHLAEERPLLCLVDDAQWLDRPSAEALLFAARRLDREGVVVLFAVREHSGEFAPAGVPELPLAGLDPDSAGELLDDLGAALPVDQRERLIAETHGNPLALRELPPLIAARGAHLGVIPLTSRVLDAFHHQVRALPAASGQMLLVAAADDTGDVPTLLRAAGGLALGVADLQPAETSGLVSVTAEGLAFRHPLIRAAVYHGAPLAQRVAVHAALAEAHADDADRRAWHLALAATGADERVAADLERAADRAQARGGHGAAAVTFERAAALSADRDAATRRIVLACEAGVHGGRSEWARGRAERAARDVADPIVLARLAAVRASADFAQGELRRAHGLLTDAALRIAADDPERAFWMLMQALHAAWAAPTDEELIAATVDRFDAPGLDPEGPLMGVAWLARWATALVLDRDPAGFPALDTVLSRAREAGAAAGPRALLEVASRAFVAARDEECADIATTLVTRARERGTVHALPGGLGIATLAQVVLGRHREAWISGTEAMAIARDTGQPLWTSYAAGALAYLAAVEGNEQRCREHAELAALGGGTSASAMSGVAWAEAGLALLDLGSGRVQGCLDRLQAMAHGPSRHLAAVVRSVPTEIEAAVRLGRPADAVEPLELFTRWAAILRRPWIDALLARCHALTAPDTDAEQHFERALALHTTASRPFEHARTALLYGEWLRRAKRKTDARVQLAAALAAFEEIGSQPWAARARAELGASGARTPQAAPSPAFGGLTPQELQITQLAAQGLSNRDIAAQLILSPRTVAYHLYKAYPKLGISSRVELAHLAR
ncbi:regulatory LuxR family protein [Pseudonocardia hierapolitana]|uniref:Regulatory LuxR family protein n=1 Tax=Pseudonocardia hierapolitana TaxID=1128676 RepID=A0A561SPT3_9PSEU|nr:helix-turn-helix transcriptional regulator [Pseudonocardia hierapolitana]TWF76880.1 regulatory LuxR family protein [Pseudonocardia hierapolitana]